jgi:hypothetical protein
MRSIARAAAAYTTVALALGPASLAAQSMLRHRFGLELLGPGMGTLVQSFGTAVVGPPVEFTTPQGLAVDFWEYSIHVYPVVGTPVSFPAGPFYGFRIFDPAGRPDPFRDVRVSNCTGPREICAFPAYIDRATFDGSNVYINLQGITFGRNQVTILSLDINQHLIPEPTTLALTSGGVLALAACAGRRRTQGSRQRASTS